MSLPLQLTVAHYIDLEAASARGFEHVTYLRTSFQVVAVLDGLHEYLTTTLAAEVQSASGDVQQLRGGTPEASPPHPTVGHAFLSTPPLQQGIFCPERIIGSSAATDLSVQILLVSQGVKVYGGVFDVSQGPIFLGDGVSVHAFPLKRRALISPCTRKVTVESGVLVKGPAYIGARTTLRHGAYVRGDCVLGADGVFGGELKAA
ncbi:MAG: hypothetical protein SGPRY_011889 [Prymnesium sp.]